MREAVTDGGGPLRPVINPPTGPIPAMPPLPAGPTERPILLPDPLLWLNGLIGQMCEGFVYLMAGAPGSMKSRLTTQIAVEFARRGDLVSFLLTEEREARLRQRISALLSQTDPAEAAATQARIRADDSLDQIDHLPNWVASQVLSPYGRHHGSKLLIIDSLMGHGLSSTSATRWERVFDGLRLLRRSGATTIGVAHVTKANAIGGPRTLAHNVDAVLTLKQLGNYRCLYCVKNRAGPADARSPAKLQINPATLALDPAPVSQMLVVCARSLVPALGPIEIQTAVSLSVGAQRRIIGSHLPRRELEQLLGVIGGVPGLNLDDLDFSVSCRLPGSKGYLPIMGLPLCVALVGSATQRAIPDHLLFVGEIDLQRAIREITPEQADAIRGVLTFITTPVEIICSPETAALLASTDGEATYRCRPCRTLDEAIFQTWPETR